MRGEIAGPPDTPYEKGTFLLEIHVPETYPFNPPKVKFITKIWHPNISSVTGAICLDILKDNWAAAMTLRTVLLSLQALLAAAEPDDPQDAVVSRQYKDNYEMFCKTAKVWLSVLSLLPSLTYIIWNISLQHWTNVYAKGPHKFPDFDAKVQRLRDMGVNDFDARAALSRHNWDINLATNDIFWLTLRNNSIVHVS